MIYLDNSATTRYKPPEVIRAVTASLCDTANPGRSGHAAALAAAETVWQTRESLLRAFRCGGNCVFTGGCTHALNLALFGIPKGGHVVTTATEHNSVLRPLCYLASHGFVKLTVLQPDCDGAITVAALAAVCRKDTRLVAVNAVSNVTGAAQNLKELGRFCRSREILFLADAAQAAGYLPIDMQADCIDLLALAPHKGLHAPMGVGALLVDERVRLEPLLLGGTGTDSVNPVQHGVIPEGLESGTLPFPAIAGLRAALEWAMPNLKAHAAHNFALSERALTGLRNIPGVRVYSRPNPSGVVSFNVGALESASVADALDRRGICVRGGLHCAPRMHAWLGTVDRGAVRASVSVDNTDAEIDALVAAVDEISLSERR